MECDERRLYIYIYGEIMCFSCFCLLKVAIFPDSRANRIKIYNKNYINILSFIFTTFSDISTRIGLVVAQRAFALYSYAIH